MLYSPVEAVCVAMKVLFLDIDGVLTTSRSRRKAIDHCDRNCVLELLHIVGQTGCKIVVSSSWRIFGEQHVKDALQANGAPVFAIIGFTPDLHGEERGDEIQAWLDSNPDVEKFAIVDDDADMGHLLGYLIRTDDGLTHAQAEDIIYKLNG